jgi:para-nitrobenzyl esterase
MYMSKLTQQVTYPIVETKAGKLRGLCKEGGYIFRGVRYGQAERFQLAKPVTPWAGVQDALVYGYVAPELYTKLSPDQFQQQHYYSPQHEDCQYLNLWTQHLGSDAKRPIVVWFHGGGWNGGSSIEQFAYDGENMSRYGDLVFISIEHRLNCLGGLDLSAYGDRYRYSNWASLSDTLVALHWIQENAAVFGGDANNVTLIGHAGGAPQVMALLNCVEADGLYHKVAIAGNVIGHTTVPSGRTAKEIAQRVATLTVEGLGLTAETLEQIETIPYWYLAEAAYDAREQIQQEIGGKFQFEPVADGVHLMEHTLEHPLRPETAHIPMLSGGDFGDASSNFRKPLGDNLKDRWSEETKLAYLQNMYGAQTPALIRAFQKAYPGRNLADLLFVDRKARNKNLRVLQAHAAAGGKVWSWLFALNLPIDGGTVPWHCCDTAYLTHNARYMESTYIPGVSDRLQDQLCSAYVAFAEHGDPNNELLPQWDAVTEGRIPTMVLEEQPWVGINHDQELQLLLQPWFQ